MSNIPKWKILSTPTQQRRSVELFSLVLATIVLIFTALIISGLFLFRYYANEVPTSESIAILLSDRSENSSIYDRNGVLLYTFRSPVQDREYVEFAEIPATVIATTLAAEDKDFFAHQGIDYFATFKALLTNIFGTGNEVVGGSTISQQLVKQTVLTSEKTLERKVKEAMVTMSVESAYSKEQILEYYLNSVSYGGRVIGISAAAQSYFGKDLGDLTLGEAAYLAGLVRSPGEYSPLFASDRNSATQLAQERYEYVISQLEQNPYLAEFVETKDLDLLRDRRGQGNTANIAGLSTATIALNPPTEDILAPHWVFYIRQLLESPPFNITGAELYSGGYEVKTTLDYRIQQIAEVELKQGVEQLGWQYGFVNGGLVTIDPKTGDVLAMVGSRDYFGNEEDGKFDPEVNVTLSRQPLGSSLKPWVAYLGFKSGQFTPSTTVFDTPETFAQGYSPKNADGKFNGAMSVRTALLTSRNLPFLKMSDTIGAKQLPNLMQQIGYRTDTGNIYGLSATIGGVDETLLDHVTAYTGLANSGPVMERREILYIKNSSGKSIYQAPAPKVKYNLDRDFAVQVNSILGDKSYSSGLYALKFIGDNKLAGKTGTSDKNKDTYYIGYGPTFVTGIWTGNNDNTRMVGYAYGINTGLPIWNSYTEALLTEFRSLRSSGSY